ncbi:hypothetical protein ABFS82_09G037000 [Erythranthe guttata]|uniref:Pectinesterase inhibitor domain-containing protein n=1 Tax=Erythranthe guttata TaxID=4155 RepID=A0A022R5K6_ERYGU|nr:hypothetical protein MIMGU_mgv1a012470mg [Erythranthe guttata]
MKSANNNTTNLLEKQDHEILSKILQRKNITTFFITFFISITLIISSLIFYLVHDISSKYSPINPVLQTPNPDNKPDPNQAFILSLQTSAQQLENITSFISINGADDMVPSAAFKNCSNSLRHGSGRIRNALTTIRVNPLLETPSYSEQRFEMAGSIYAAEEDLETCVGDLGKVEMESTAVIELRMKVLDALVHLRSRGDFLVYSDEYKVTHSLWSDIADEISNYLFVVLVCCLQLMFIFFLFWTICRFN